MTAAGRGRDGLRALVLLRIAGAALVLATVIPPCGRTALSAASDGTEIESSVSDEEGLRPAQDTAADSPHPFIAIRLTPSALEIRGNLADARQHSELLAAVRSVYPDLPITTVTDEKAAAGGREAVRLATAAIELLRFLATGEADILSDRIVLRGSTFHAAAWQALADAVGTGGVNVSIDGVSTGHAGPPRPAAECEVAVGTLVGELPIEFDAGRATLAGEARALVDRISYELSGCLGALVAVAGHTDSDGTDEANYRLSLARARTVIDMIVANGLPVDRFTPLGYGESRPLASNATERGKAINRRIEFKLRD